MIDTEKAMREIVNRDAIAQQEWVEVMSQYLLDHPTCQHQRCGARSTQIVRHPFKPEWVSLCERCRTVLNGPVQKGDRVCEFRAKLHARSTPEIKARRAGDNVLVTGYGVRFGVLIPQPKAFMRFGRHSLDETPTHRTCFLFNHEADWLLARVPHTMQVAIDDVGLAFTAKINMKTNHGEHVGELLLRGDLDQTSPGFTSSKFDEEWDFSGTKPIRTIRRVTALYDISLATFAATPTVE